MNTLKSISSIFWPILIIISAFACSWLATTWITKHYTERGLIDASMSFTQQDLRSLQNAIDMAPNSKRLVETWQVFTNSGLVNRYKSLFAIDAQQKVLQAKHASHIGHVISTLKSDFDLNRFKRLLAQKQSSVSFDSEHSTISIYLPVRLHQGQQNNIGAIIAEYDLSGPRNTLWAQALLSSLATALIFLTLMLAWAFFLRLKAESALDYLVHKTRALGKNIPSDGMTFSGQRKLAQLDSELNDKDRYLQQESAESRRTEEELRASEAQFRSLAENSKDYIVRYDSECRHLYQNAEAYKVSGFTEQEFVGKTHRELGFDVELCDLWEEKINFVFSSKETVSEIFEWESIEGKVYLDWRLYPEFSSNGQVETVLGVSRDITKNKRLESQLIRTKKMESLGTLTGGIAHDFNNLLGIIHGNVELINLTAQLDTKSRSRLDSIMKATNRATNLTKQLLGFSRRKRTSVNAIDISWVIKDFAKMIEHSVPTRIQVEYQLADTLWNCDIDRGDFEDALLNLVINARDAISNSGTLKITTANKVLDEHCYDIYPELIPGNYICLTVSDTGHGISSENIEHIFEPFFTTKTQGKGTGLGLSMAFGFAKRSAGHINATSKLGIGTSFNLFLPQSSGRLEEQLPKPTPDPKILPGGDETILVVDDEQGLREMAQLSLSSLGYTVFTAGNAEQAMQTLKKEPHIQLLFSDIVMPGSLNGYELAEQALQFKPDLKMALCSGFASNALASDHQKLLNVEVLNKPYTLSELSTLLRTILDADSVSHQKNHHWINSQCAQLDSQPQKSDSKRLCLGKEAVLAILDLCEQNIREDKLSDLPPLLDQLLRASQEHFEREEILMDVIEYTGKENHQLVHQLFMRQAEHMHAQFIESKIGAVELITFIRNWLTEHSKSMDVAYLPICGDKYAVIEAALYSFSMRLGRK